MGNDGDKYRQIQKNSDEERERERERERETSKTTDVVQTFETDIVGIRVPVVAESRAEEEEEEEEDDDAANDT